MNTVMKNATTVAPHPLSATASPTDEQESVWSALQDGELSADQSRQILKNLRNDAEGKTRFSTYCAIGDAMRGHADIRCSPDFTQRVMAALEKEPTILAPIRKPANRQTTAWLAAAAISAITWGLWTSLPEERTTIPLAANPASPTENVSPDISPYLAAHQDFAQAVLAPTEMNFTQVSLAQANQ
jgi:sigma-E factor negative regulatory protein RseA